MRPPILITGCARSGTSMTAGIIYLCGGFGGYLSGPTPNNKKGMFENNNIRDNVVKPYLKSIGMDPLGQRPLPTLDDLTPMRNLASEVEYVLKDEGYQEDVWFYKGAKMCLMWPLWQRAFPDAKWIIVRRYDRDIINSCMRTGFMRAFKDEAGWQSWVDHHRERFEEMQEVLDVREVWPSEFVRGNFAPIKMIVEWIGLEWNQEEVTQFIEPAFWSEADGS